MCWSLEICSLKQGQPSPAVVLPSHCLVCLLLCAAVDPCAPIVMGQEPRTGSPGEERLCGFTQIPRLMMKIQSFELSEWLKPKSPSESS